MLDYKKTGRLICEERQNINLTQEQLAEKLFVTRQAVSKWERGKCMPDYDSLLSLSEIFTISLNELIAGERSNETNKSKINNIILHTLKEKDESILFITFIFSILLIAIILIFLSYYFFSTYNKLRVFKFTGENNNYYVNDVIGVFSNENSYLKLNQIMSINNQHYDYIELYYLKDNIRQLICKTSNSNILISEFNGYKEYFDYKSINAVINNLYIDIYSNNQVETIKLQSLELYSNKSLFFKRYNFIGN